MNLAPHLIPYISILQKLLPSDIAFRLTQLAGNSLSFFQKNRRNSLEYNLSRFGFNNVNEISKNAIENWTICVADQIATLWFSRKDLTMRIDDQGSKNLKESLKLGKGVLLITAHLGNYEIAGSYLAAQGFPIHAVVENIPGAHGHIFNRIRRKFGMQVVNYSNISRMFDILRRKEILILLADRALGKTGISLRFGKSERLLPAGPAILALRTGACIQTGYMVLNNNRRTYKLVIDPCFQPKLKNPNKVNHLRLSLSQKIAKILSSYIHKYPDQWFVFQNEWDKKQTDIDL